MLSRFLHSFRWALQPVKHISSRRFARLSSHLLCNATVPVQFHSLVWLATDKWQQQFATIYEISALERDSFRIEAKPRRDKSWKTRSRNLFWVRIWFSLCSADCGNWCCDTLITQPMRLLRNSYKFFNKSDKSKTPPTLSLRPPRAWHVSNSSKILAPNCNIYRTTRKQAVPVLNNPQKNPNIRSTRH